MILLDIFRPGKILWLPVSCWSWDSVLCDTIWDECPHWLHWAEWWGRIPGVCHGLDTECLLNWKCLLKFRVEKYLIKFLWLSLTLFSTHTILTIHTITLSLLSAFISNNHNGVLKVCIYLFMWKSLVEVLGDWRVL